MSTSVTGLEVHTRSLRTAATILHERRSPTPTILSLDLGEISSIIYSLISNRICRLVRIIDQRTCAANKKLRSPSQSLSISPSSSFSISPSRTAARAAEM